MRGDGPKRILIADYEEIVRKSLGLVFAQRGCECRTMASGEQAVAIAGEWAPDVIVMDFLLSGTMLGLEAAEILRERCPDAVILLSCSTSVSPLIREAEEQGFRVSIKPVPPQVLLEAAGIK